MKAITLPPENAALVAAGEQTIITTARRPRLAAGDRLAIHAGTRLQPPGTWIGVTPTKFGPRIEAVVDRGCLFRGDQCIPPYHGHIVASAVVRDVVPIVNSAEWCSPCNQSRWTTPVITVGATGVAKVRRSGEVGPDQLVTNQLPLADFTPGRWAVLLDDVAHTTDRCPACWGTCPGCLNEQGSVCFRCVGLRRDITCPPCDGAGTCSPIPQRGGPGVWRWEP